MQHTPQNNKSVGIWPRNDTLSILTDKNLLALQMHTKYCVHLIFDVMGKMSHLFDPMPGHYWTDDVLRLQRGI